ncbi:MAG TPA: DUF2267 domain-containing protein [Micromonosporaceae bacterium]|nr:DUF2267 domain-containing protein [Micromonosporaceae bacterium]
MSGRQMEGDNQRRRTLARRAREQGRQPSQAEATLGSSQQVEHLNQKHRAGPPAAGARKPKPQHGAAPTPPPAAATPPLMDPAVSDLPAGEGFTPLRYRELVENVRRRARLDFEQARRAAEATVIALARALDDQDRQRLLEAVPPALRNDYPVVTPRQPCTLTGFLDDVARMTLHSREQARYQAQAALNALAEQSGDLVESLDIPTDIRDLLAPQPTGGGLVDVARHVAPLTDDEVKAALADLPYWSGSSRALLRAVVLPPENLDRVVQRLELLREETGRAPHIERRDGTALIVVRTQSVNAVTALDIDLAHAVDAAIDEVGAGIAS